MNTSRASEGGPRLKSNRPKSTSPAHQPSAQSERRRAVQSHHLLTFFALLLLFPLSFPACTSSNTLSATTKVSANDFKSPTSAAGSVGGTSTGKGETAPTIAADTVKPLRSGPVSASDGIFDAAAEVGAPELDNSTPKEVGAPIFVDAKIGDVNNRAIYASTFLEEMSDRLTTEYAKLVKADARRGKAAWRRLATEEIQRKLNGIIEDEVLRAEALNSLKPEQKAGFFNWLNTVRSEVVAENRGIEAAANESLSARDGGTLDQYMKNREQQELINFILQTRIKARVNTSWRDIQLQYERQYREFNPPPLAYFRVLSVNTKDAAEVKRITDALASGTDFNKLADEKLPPRKAKADDDVAPDEEEQDAEKFLIASFEDEYEKHDFFGPKELNEAVHPLQPGQHTGPIEVRNTAYWIKLEKIQRMSMDLYNAQIGLDYSLTGGRFNYEQRRFVEKLKRRASFTDFETMTRRLLEILEERVSSNVAAGNVPSEKPTEKPIEKPTEKPTEKPADAPR
jgi:hypothetical protein